MLPNLGIQVYQKVVNNIQLTSLYPKRKRHTELVQDILSQGYQLNSGVTLATRVLHRGEISGKGEADVTTEIISLIDSNVKIQKDNKHQGWR